MSESLSLSCPRCGAALPADPTQASVACAYCRAVVPIPPDVRQRAAELAARVEAARRKADAASQAASQMRFWAQGQNASYVVIGAVIVGMMGLGFVMNLLAPLLPREVVPIVMPVALYGSLGVAGVVLYRRYKRRQRDAAAPLAVARAICTRCGGPLTFEAGSASAVCHACNATALPGKTIVRELADAAERRADALEIERARAERQMYRGIASTQRFGFYYMLVAMGWPVVALGVIGPIAGVSELVSGLVSGKPRDVAHGLEAFGIGCLLLVLALAVAAAVYALVLRPMLAAGAALRALTARLGGATQQTGAVATLDWLDAFWPGPARMELMVGQGELLRYTFNTRIEGLPVMIVVLCGGSKVRGPRLHVLVAAPRPRDEGGVRASPPAQELMRAGFDVKASHAGVTLEHPGGAEVVNEAMLGWVMRVGIAAART